MDDFMRIAVDEAIKGVENNHGGPFGAVVVKDNVVIATAHNEVIKNNDPTDHAEMIAIRKAAQKLGRFDLSDCELYSSCEPCPMCFSAIYWAKIGKVYYGGTREDAAKAGFDDDYIYQVLKSMGEAKVEFVNDKRNFAKEPFEKWNKKVDKVQY